MSNCNWIIPVVLAFSWAWPLVCLAALEEQAAMELAGELIEASRDGDRKKLHSIATDHASDLDVAAEVYEGNAVVALGSGICHSVKGNHDEAVALLERAWKQSKHHTTIAPFYAEALIRTKETLKANEVLEESFKKSPEDPYVIPVLSHNYVRTQRYQEAIPLLKKILSEYEDSGSDTQELRNGRALYLIALAECELHLTEYDDAIQNLRKAEEDLESVLVLSPLAEAYLKSGRESEAKIELAKALRLKKDHPAVLYHTALLLRKEGKPAAEECYQRAFKAAEKLESKPGFQGPQYFLFALICSALGDEDLANQHRQRAKELGYTYETPWKEESLNRASNPESLPNVQQSP
ncbi:tetratricopeptide repeat protein [Aeoliella sp.]|uniref:tetratricopeptide repeat protein n=1 Tax=Aeoliella sp. TaxID=2795800 RepID=UPI003CCBDC80